MGDWADFQAPAYLAALKEKICVVCHRCRDAGVGLGRCHAATLRPGSQAELLAGITLTDARLIALSLPRR
jgi:hypothetical protein